MKFLRSFMLILMLTVFTKGSYVSFDDFGKWLFHNDNKTIITFGNIPGDIYSILEQNEFIKDPLSDFNDMKSIWIASENWTAISNFIVPDDLLNLFFINLNIHGLDTYAEVILNGEFIGKTSNMFNKFSFPVKDILKKDNELIFKFQSPLYMSQSLANQSAYSIPPNCPPTVQHGQCHVNMLRKMQSSFSWDWGPAIPTIGIWDSLNIEAYSLTKIDWINFYPSLNKEGNAWTARIVVQFNFSRQIDVSCAIVEIQELSARKTICRSFRAGVNILDVTLFDNYTNVEPWWPNSYGNPKLYSLRVYLPEDRSVEMIKQIGFRMVDLIQESIPQSPGLSFYFRMNGRPIFMQGSNYVPTSLTVSAGREQRARYLLTSARAIGINMLRLWGGGRFESDHFYSLCDELGITIWHDLMFACSTYPTTDRFLENVASEVEFNIRRLQHHPSIVLWAGNNENEVAIAQGWYTPKMDERYVRDYKTLYFKLIEPIVTRTDPSRPFVSSSPSNGVKTVEEGGIAANPQDVHYGDVHFYLYTGDVWNVNLYPDSRFTSEFGFQSLPSWSTWKNSVDNESYVDLSYNGSLIQHRQHHPQGMTQIFDAIAFYFKNPPVGKVIEDNYRKMSYLSQIVQAVIYKNYITKLRRNQCSPFRSMGALYWQLNDVWAAPTWSSIDFDGNWKLAHYYAKKSFAKRFLSLHQDPDSISVQGHLIMTGDDSKAADSLARVLITINCYDFQHFQPTASWNITVNVLPEDCRVWKLFDHSISELTRKCRCKYPNQCFLSTSALHSRLEIASDWIMLTAPKTIDWSRSKNRITIENVNRINSTYFTVTIKSLSPTVFVWLNADSIKGSFSDNGFAIFVEFTRVTFNSWEPVDLHHFTRSLTLQYLESVYRDNNEI